MRIAHVVRTLDPASGGPAMVATRLAKAQAQLGHCVALISGEGPSQPPVGWLPCAASEKFRVLPPGTDLPAEINRADAVHLHGVWDRILFRAAAAARRAGVPYVITPHGMLDPWSLAQKRWKKRFALALGYRAMLNRAAALHLLNDDERRLIGPLGLRTTTVVIPNGVSLDEIEIPANANSFSAAHDRLAERPYVLFMGRLHYKKGLDILIEAFRFVAQRLPDVRLVVAGPDDGVRADLERWIAEPPLQGSVVIAGPVYGSQKWAALAGAACFCLPSRQEGFSVAILEAMACRIPVVVSTGCHFPEVAEVGAGAIVPLDAEQVAQALTEFLANPDRAQMAGIAGRRLVEERFTWSQIARRSEELYRPVAVTASVA